MTTTATVLLRAIATDGVQEVQRFTTDASIADVCGINGQRQTVTLTAAFTALTPPTGATFVCIQMTTGTATLTLKGVTGDTGIVLNAAALLTLPICLPLVAASSSIGILSDGAATLDLLWL